MLSITALNQELKRASSSAKGKIDFAAPGIDILSTDKDGGYSLFSGTSFATAFATGVTAAHLDEYRSIHGPDRVNIDDYLDYLLTQVEPLGKKDQQSEYGHGLLKIN